MDLDSRIWPPDTAVGDLEPVRTTPPPLDPREVDELGLFLDRHQDEPIALTGSDGEELPVPPEVRQVLAQAALALREGRAVTVLAVSQRLSLRQAAALLGLDRSALLELVADGELPTGRDGCLALADVVALHERRRAAQLAQLEDMARYAENAAP